MIARGTTTSSARLQQLSRHLLLVGRPTAPPFSPPRAISTTVSTARRIHKRSNTMAPERHLQPAKNKLQGWFPNTKLPVIISAPMKGISNGTLAAQVSKAGGFGFIPAALDLNPGSNDLSGLEKDLQAARAVLNLTEMTLTPAPVGVAFTTCHASVTRFRETVVPLLEKYLPQAVWLFAPDPSVQNRAHADIIEACHDRGLKVWVQVGNVAAAREALRDGADALVAQGIDAGGHQFAAGAGIVSLVPEVRALVEEEVKGQREVVVVAAGGIANGSAVVGAIALGAEGAVMGTKFMPCKEANTTEAKKKAILETTDGGLSTAKSTFHDDIVGTTFWPVAYDGRAIITDSYRDHTSGLSLDENKVKFKAAMDAGDNSRQMCWAGTGVGLVKDAIPAADIVRNTRDEARQRLHAMRYAFDEDGKEEKDDQSLLRQIGHSLYKHK